MRYKIIDQQGLNFLTLTIVEWIDLFTRPVYCEIVLESLRFCQQHKGLQVFSYVIMPSHVHLVVRAEQIGLSKVLQQLKSFTAKQILSYLMDTAQIESRREWLLHHFSYNARRNRTNSQHQIWQRNNHPIALFSSKVIRQKIDYIHLNPVRTNIVAQADHYLYSSASNYATGNGLLQVSILEDIWLDDTGYVQG